MNKYKFNKDHQWILQEKNQIIKIGITNYAQKNLGDIIYIQIKESNIIYNQHEIVGNIESVKNISDIYAPFKGKIINFNLLLNKKPELINLDPYKTGWLFEMIVEKNDINFDNFISYEEYKKIFN